MEKLNIKFAFLVILLFSLSNYSTAQYNVFKFDVFGATTDQFFRPSFEHTFKNFSAVVTYELGTYEEDKSTRSVNYGDVIYHLKGWGIIPEIRYYPFHENIISPNGFFIGTYYSYKSLEEYYHDKGFEFTTNGSAWNAGLNTGYKSFFGKRVCAEIMFGCGLAGGTFDEPNQRNAIEGDYEASDLDAFSRSIRFEISIGVIFPKQIIPSKKYISPPASDLSQINIPANSDSSTIIFYHPARTFSSDYSYAVSINDSQIYIADWGTADTIKIKANSELTIKAKIVEQESINFTPEKNKLYFIKCGLGTGLLSGKPLFEFIDPGKAQKDLKKLK
jgi:hypothetical protein